MCMFLNLNHEMTPSKPQIVDVVTGWETIPLEFVYPRLMSTKGGAMA